MPDDALFPTGSEPAPQPQASGGEQPPAPAPKPDATARLDALESSFKQLTSGVAGAFDKMASFLNERLPAPTRRADSSQPDGADAIATRILTDPKSVLDEHFMAQAKAKLGPALNVMIDGQHDLILRDLSSSFDEQHGEGSFDKFIREDYFGALEKLPYETRANRATLEALVNGIRGSAKKFEEIVGAYNETKTRRARERESPPALISGSRTPPSVSRLSDEDRAHLADYVKKTGATDVSEKNLLEVRKARDPRLGWSDETFPRIVPKKETAA